MTLHVEETEGSRIRSAGYEKNQQSRDFDFICWDDTNADVDSEAVVAAVFAVATAAPYGDPLFGLRLQTINTREMAPFIHSAIVHYGMFEPPKENVIKIGFGTGGSSEHVTHGLATISRHAATGLALPPLDHFGGAINVTKDGPQGTPRESASLPIRVTAQFAPANWNQAQLLNIRALSKCWNLSDWHGWPATYLQFQHVEVADYELGTGLLVPVTFHFLASQPEVVNKGNGIVFTKHPWSLVWDYSIEKIQTIGGVTIKGREIIYTFEEHLYPGADFSLLGIGS